MIALNRFDPIDDPYDNPGNEKVLDASQINDPIRDGAANISAGVWWIKKPAITGFDDAKVSLLDSVQNAVNRVLGFLALIAVIYLIIQGIQLLLKPKDDELKKIRARIEAAIWAIGGIGLSWLLVAFVFRAIGIFTDS